MNEPGLRHIPGERKTNQGWVTCPDGHVGRPTSPLDAGMCPNDQKARAPIWIEQRRILWADEATISSTAVIPENGMADPTVVMRELWNRTVRSANFKVDPQILEDADFGWFLYEWLGGRDLIQKITKRALDRKNGNAGSGTPSTGPATTSHANAPIDS